MSAASPPTSALGARIPARSARPHRASFETRLVLWLFLALLLEGMARKWIFPQQHQYFYFFRDPLVILLYALAVARVRWWPHGWLAAWVIAGAAISLMSLTVYLAKEKPALVWGLGVRSYFLYVPLAFLIGGIFRRDMVLRFARVAALASIPVAIVAVLQHYAAPGAWINRGAGGAVPPLLAGNVLRTTGLLASDAQQTTFIIFVFALSAALAVGERRRTSRRIGIIGVCASLVMMTVSGSRAVWILGLLVLGGVLASVFVARTNVAARARGVWLAALTAALTIVLFANIFTRALVAYEERNRVARTFSDATVERIVGMFVPRWMFEASLEGEGIGIALTGATAVLTGERKLTLAETDWDRNFVELGLLGGTAFVLLRITFSIWLVSVAFRAARRGAMIPLILASHAAPAILISQITMHTAYAQLAWMGAGLTIASARQELVRQSRPWKYSPRHGIGMLRPRRGKRVPAFRVRNEP